jgi:hypothetical protein
MNFTISAILILIFLCRCSTAQENPEPDQNNRFTPDHILANYKMVWSDEFDGTSVNKPK